MPGYLFHDAGHQRGGIFRFNFEDTNANADQYKNDGGSFRQLLEITVKISSKFSISTRLRLILPIAILGMLSVASISYFKDNAMAKMDAKRTSIVVQTNLISRLNDALTKAHLREAEFVLHSDASAADEFNSASKAASIWMLVLTNSGVPKNSELAGQIRDVATAYVEYSRAMYDLIDTREKMGFTDDDGAVGAMRTSARELEDKITEIARPDLTVALLTMRRHEKDFMLWGDAKYAEKLEAVASALANVAASDFGGPGVKQKSLQAAQKYLDDFKKYASLFSKQQSLSEQISQKFAAIEPLFKAIQIFSDREAGRINREQDAFQVRVARIQYATIGVLMSLIIASVLLVSRSITLPLAAVVRSMTRLHNGDLRIDIAGTERSDEIGAMARAVAVFRDNAVERVRLEREAEANRSQTEQERIERDRRQSEEAADIRLAVDSLGDGLGKLAQGKLNFRIEHSFAPRLDQVRNDFNEAVGKLEDTMRRVGQNAQTIAAGSAQIRAAAEDLSRRTEQQAASVEETAAALEQITATVVNSSHRAEEAGQQVLQTRGAAERSGEIVNGAVSAMHEIEASSHQISNIIGVIDEIAFQTNLLALNAGVEAARAGEAGKGFAVVAQEVRELAQRSANAAKEIKTLIGKSGAQVKNGVDLVTETGKALQQIVVEVQAVSTNVTAIVEGAKEQAIGLAEVNSAVNTMDQGTQQNAAMVEESTAASHSLAQEAAALFQLIACFEIDQVSAHSIRENSAVGTTSPMRRMLNRARPIAGDYLIDGAA